MKKKGGRKKMVTNLPLIQNLEFEGRNIYPLVVRLVSKTWNGQGRRGSLEYQDLIGEALLALLQAHRRFSRGSVKFSTFAYRRIQGAAQDLLRRETTYGNRFEPTTPHALIQKAGGADGLEQRAGTRKAFLQVIDILEGKLDSLEAVVLIRSFLEDRSDKEIAKEFHLSVQRVEELRSQGIHSIRRFLLMPDYERREN